MTTVEAVIVEDEPLARRALREFVAEVDWLACVGEACDGTSAVRAIDDLRPALVFLDVRMPGIDGIEVLRRIAHRPEVVFTTAYDHYAVTAFEVGALDYLVKPFGRARFHKMLDRVRATVLAAERGPSASERAFEAMGGPLRRLFARRDRHIVPIPLESVTRIEARGDYVAVHHPGGTHLMHVALSELETRLDPERFFRVHRSHIVGLDHIATIRPRDDRRFSIVMADGAEIVASRAGSHRLRERLK